MQTRSLLPNRCKIIGPNISLPAFVLMYKERRALLKENI